MVTATLTQKPQPIMYAGEEWVEGWHKHYKMKSISTFEDEISALDRKPEIEAFLSILKEIDKTHVSLLELGAGWGEWCLALAGAVRYRLVPHKVKTFDYLAVEGEPYYCELIKKHFMFNMLPVNVLNCAVSDEDGICYFDKFSGEKTFFDTWCTQGMTFNGNIAGSKLKTWIMAMYRILRKEVVKVPMLKVDTILKLYNFNPDIIHIDVNGVEGKIVKSTAYCPYYWIIGTHHKNINMEIKEHLSKRYECLVDMNPPKEKQRGLLQDGLQVFKLKEYK